MNYDLHEETEFARAQSDGPDDAAAGAAKIDLLGNTLRGTVPTKEALVAAAAALAARESSINGEEEEAASGLTERDPRVPQIGIAIPAAVVAQVPPGPSPGRRGAGLRKETSENVDLDAVGNGKVIASAPIVAM